jgi:hypothetical protein
LKALGCLLRTLALVIAARPVSALRSIEADQAITLAIHSHSIAVDDLDGNRRTRIGT